MLSGLIRVYKELTEKEDITQLQVEDALGRCNRQVVINEDGYGEFSVHGKSVSVWIPRL